MNETQVSVSTEDDRELRFDRRFRLAKEIVIGIVFITGWLLRLEWSQKTEHDSNVQTHKEMKAQLMLMDSTIDNNSKEIYGIERDIEWLKHGR